MMDFNGYGVTKGYEQWLIFVYIIVSQSLVAQPFHHIWWKSSSLEETIIITILSVPQCTAATVLVFQLNICMLFHTAIYSI